jgi:chaperone modulatory protein CbpM
MSMSREQFLAISGAKLQKLEFWLEQRWLIPEPADAGSGFTEREVARARLIDDLENDFGVNNEGIDIILHLIDQLHGMRRAFAHLQADFGGRPSAPPSSSEARRSE